MANVAGDLGLEPSELAFVFDTELGVDAQDLGVFLQRASTVARRAGGDVYITALRPGSLAVVARVLRRGAKASGEEFKSSPIRTTGAALGIVGVVASAIGAAMQPHPGFASPLAKAGATLVDKRGITQISLVSLNETEIIMDAQRAATVRSIDAEREQSLLPAPDVRRLMASARQGDLSGTMVLADDQLHFRPDGFRYLVPVELAHNRDWSEIRPGRHLGSGPVKRLAAQGRG